MVGPLSVWILDKALRGGATKINTGLLLPFNVTGMVVKRQAKFNFNAGNWVFVNILAITAHKWLPFTISSAPEVCQFWFSGDL